MRGFLLVFGLLLGCPGSEGDADTSDVEETGGSPDSGDPGACETALDADCDGYPATEDCNDTDPAIYPGARDEWDGNPEVTVDSDCNGTDSAFRSVVWSDMSLQSVADYDGDGVADFLSAYEYEGDWSAWPWTAADVMAMQEERFAEAVVPMFDWLEYGGERFYNISTGSPVGDLDGDGRVELVFSCSDPNGSPAALCLFNGDTLYDTGYRHVSALLGELPSHNQPVRLLGDLDGDGVEELAVGAAPARVVSTADLLLPEFNLDAAERSLELEYDPSGGIPLDYLELNFGLEQVDVDGDGVDELFTGSRFYWGADLALAGSYASAEAVHPATLHADTADCTSGNAGDVTGDGQPDLWFHSLVQGDHGRVYLAELTGATHDTVTLFATVDGSEAAELGVVVGTVGDADEDGFGDVGMSDQHASTPEGYGIGLYVLPGRRLSGSVTVDGSERYIYAHSFADFALLDYDGDGREDLMVDFLLMPFADILP